jgi:hypothetical protein
VLATREGGYVFWACLAAVPAILLYWNGFKAAERLRRLPVLNLLYLWLRERMFFDSLYNGAVVGGMLVASEVAAFVDRFVLGGIGRFIVLLIRAVSRLCAAIDRLIVHGLVNGISQGARVMGEGLLIPHAGRVRIYILVTLAGLGVLGGVVILAAYVVR